MPRTIRIGLSLKAIAVPPSCDERDEAIPAVFAEQLVAGLGETAEDRPVGEADADRHKCAEKLEVDSGLHGCNGT